MADPNDPLKASRSGGLAVAWASFRRECRHGIGYGLWWFWMRFYLRFIKTRMNRHVLSSPADGQRSITVIIPAVEKDAAILAKCLRSVREMIRHQLAEIWVVSPESKTLRELAAAENCKFVHEDTVLPRPARELKCRGWVLQQFIKFNAAAAVNTRYYLVVDADTVFLRPQSFFRNGRAVLRYSDQYELLYNRSLELVFGDAHRYPVSFVAHHMLFNAAVVKGLLGLIQQRFGRNWWEAILQDVDQGHLISFSEYELYAHFVLSQPGWQNTFCLEYWRGLDQHTEDFGRFEAIKATAQGKLNTVSFHWHTQ